MNAALARLTRFAVDLYHDSDSRLIDRFLDGGERAFRKRKQSSPPVQKSFDSLSTKRTRGAVNRPPRR
jgi:hypothetical protein